MVARKLVLSSNWLNGPMARVLATDARPTATAEFPVWVGPIGGLCHQLVGQ